MRPRCSLSNVCFFTLAKMSDIMVAEKYIHELGLVPHPEGGWFKVVHVSSDHISSPYVDVQGDRGECELYTGLRSSRSIKD